MLSACVSLLLTSVTVHKSEASGRGIAQLVALCVITNLTFKHKQSYFTTHSTGCSAV